MEQNRVEPVEQKPEKRESRGYLATVLGADIGFIIGAITGVILGAVQLSTIVFTDFSGLFTLFTAIITIILGGYVGGLIGCAVALALTGQQRIVRTVGFLAVLYPVPLLLAGTDLFIGALIVPLLARWLALR